MKTKKSKKNGFTLIELLAVIVVIMAITVMAISSISAAIERSKAREDEAKKAALAAYAKLYYEDHKNSLGETGCIDISVLVLAGLDPEEYKDSNGNIFPGGIRYENKKNFHYDEEICD